MEWNGSCWMAVFRSYSDPANNIVIAPHEHLKDSLKKTLWALPLNFYLLKLSIDKIMDVLKSAI